MTVIQDNMIKNVTVEAVGFPSEVKEVNVQRVK